jgi:hypothetical protein
LLIAEKEATRTQDALAARRRRLPMVAFGAYTFTATSGDVTLRDLFGDNDQLMVYQFMDLGPDALCPGCTHFTNNVTALDVLADRGIAWATLSNMTIEQIDRVKAQHGWTVLTVSARSFPSRARSVPLKGRLRRLPGVVDRTVAQLLHRLLQVGTAVAIGGDAIGHDEGKTNGLHGSTHQLGGITWAKPRGQLSGWHGAGIRTLGGEIADPQGHHRRRRGGPNPRA